MANGDFLGERLHEFFGGSQRSGHRAGFPARIGKFHTLLAGLLWKEADGRENRPLGLGDVDPTSGERAAVAKVLDVKQQVLTNIAGGNEIAMYPECGRREGPTVLDAAITDWAMTWPP